MFNLRTLSYDKKAFDGKFISESTIDFHYGKHHQTYINNLNNLINNTEFEKKSLYEIILHSSGGIFNNAAQIYNHDFYWDCISPSKTNLSKALENAINESFGSIEKLREQFSSSATTLFGSGWCWVVVNANNKLEIMQTSNADTPLTSNKIPILVIDVWEHAYYIDYKNVRAKYIEEFFAFINWKFVSQAYEWALKEGMGSVKFYINNLHSEQV